MPAGRVVWRRRGGCSELAPAAMAGAARCRAGPGVDRWPCLPPARSGCRTVRTRTGAASPCCWSSPASSPGSTPTSAPMPRTQGPAGGAAGSVGPLAVGDMHTPGTTGSLSRPPHPCAPGAEPRPDPTRQGHTVLSGDVCGRHAGGAPGAEWVGPGVRLRPPRVSCAGAGRPPACWGPAHPLSSPTPAPPHPRYNLLFFASGGGKFNYQGTKRWLEDNLDHTGERPLRGRGARVPASCPSQPALAAPQTPACSRTTWPSCCAWTPWAGGTACTCTCPSRRGRARCSTPSCASWRWYVPSCPQLEPLGSGASGAGGFGEGLGTLPAVEAPREHRRAEPGWGAPPQRLAGVPRTTGRSAALTAPPHTGGRAPVPGGAVLHGAQEDQPGGGHPGLGARALRHPPAACLHPVPLGEPPRRPAQQHHGREVSTTAAPRPPLRPLLPQVVSGRDVDTATWRERT